MYSLDINFGIAQVQTGQSHQRSLKLRLPAGICLQYLGLATGLLLPALVGGGWLFLQNQNGQLEQKIAQVGGS